jgi:hypothetical protein
LEPTLRNLADEGSEGHDPVADVRGYFSAGSASGVLATTQQVANALGVAVVGATGLRI